MLVCAGSYQVDVDFGVAQSSSASITGHHSGFNVSHWLLSHQLDGEVLIHLGANNMTSVIISLAKQELAAHKVLSYTSWRETVAMH